MTRACRYGFRLSLLAAAWVELSVYSVLAVEKTLVASNAVCRYLVPADSTLGANWTAPSFDDSSWSPGASGLGYDTGSTYTPLFGATVPGGTTSFYVRYPFQFQIPEGKSCDILRLRVKYDDGFIAYLNGTEIARANAPENAAFDSCATTAHTDSSALLYQDFDVFSFAPLLMTGTNVLAVQALNASSSSSDLLILPELTGGMEVVTNIAVNEFMAVNDTALTNSLGKHGDWVELYNPFTNSMSLSGWYLTDNASKPTKWQFPEGAASVIAAKGYLLVWTDDKSYSVTNGELHTSFALSGGGEYLGLVAPDGSTVVYAYSPVFPEQDSDISYGIGENGEPRYFSAPTPGAVNAFAGGSNTVSGVKFTPKRGVYTNAMPTVTITTSTSGAEIRYTADAEAPATNSTLYSIPLTPAHSAIIRAAAFKSGFSPSVIDTHTYLSADDVLRQPAVPAGFPTNWLGTTNGVVGNFVVDYEMDPAIVTNAGAALTNALKALPSISLVTPLANLFDPTNGIYVNPTETGDEWERPVSAEWIASDNSSKFQVDCGLRIQGGRFRKFEDSAKKSFSLRFRSVYGEGRLEEKLFSGNAVESFNDLVLRAGATDAWSRGVYGGHEKTQYIIDEFMRRRHLAVGGVAPHGTFVHLYLNGLYWGLYNVTEKVSGEFAAAYFGGRDDTWDVLAQRNGLLEGDFTIWNAMLSLLSTNLGSNETYQRVQGNNPDGTRNVSYPVYLDVENYMDYMIVQYWSANFDWPENNWRAFRDRNEALSTGFKFSVWDAEFALGTRSVLSTDMTGSTAGIAVIQSKLISNAEYKLRFADRVQKFLFNGGELTPEVTVPCYRALAAEVEPAIVAESARWGDQDGNAAHTLAQWQTQRDYVLGTFLPQRNAMVLQHFKNRGLYPNTAAPVFSRFGGVFTNSLNLTMTSENPVYYTIDGSDPRRYGTGAAAGTRYTNGVMLTRATRVKARALSPSGVWSALTDAVFSPAEKPALRVSELMAHPAAPVSTDGETSLDGYDEFIELQNAGSTPIGLAGLHFTEGVAFDFTEGAIQVLDPGEYLLVVKDLSAFTNRYPDASVSKIAGTFAFPSQNLDNDGGKIELQDALNRTVISFTYNSSWRVATDGAGHSLIPLPGVAQTDGELDYPGNWRASVYIGGSPGTAEPAGPAASLVLNEILAYSDVAGLTGDSNDGIELYNTGTAAVTLGSGWYLSDDPRDLKKWEIPATNTAAAHGWLYFEETRDFHTSATNGFSLNKTGEQVLLSHLTGTDRDRVVDAVTFGPQENNGPLVRFPDGAATWFTGVSTPGASNRLSNADIQIAEVMYHPKPTTANPENNENDEFVELLNPTEQAVTLMNLAMPDGGAWRLTGGIDFVFPDDTVLPAGGRVAVVSFDPSTNNAARDAFLSAYDLTNGQIRLFGPCSGQLNNKTDTVKLERPVTPDTGEETVSWHAVDQLTYYDAAPWPSAADGTGRPLTRLPGQNSGDDPANWVAGLSATPGCGPAKIAVTSPEEGTGFAAPVSIDATAEIDPLFVVGTAGRVVFAVNGVDAAVVSNAPYEATIVLNACEGVQRLTARLTDDEGDYTSLTVPVMTYTNIPSFTGGQDQSINLTVINHVGLHAAVALENGMTNPVQLVWSCPGDTSVVIQNSTQADASAIFTQPGEYELILTLIYGQLVTNQFITVTVTDVNTVNRVPYKENFESYEPGSTLIGIKGWYGADAAAAVVTSNRYADAGSGGYPIRGPHLKSFSFDNDVSNLFAETSSLTNVCIDVLLACQPGTEEDPPEEPSSTQIAFWVSGTEHLMVWHGEVGGTNRWTELPDVGIASNAFTRLTVMADYSRTAQGSFGFRIWIDREPVTNPAAWFAAANTNRNFLSGITLTGEGQADDLVVDSYNSMLYRRIDTSAGLHGRVAPEGACFVPAGTSTNIVIQPDSFYGVGSLQVDGQSVDPVLNYVFTNVWDEHVLQAGFSANLTASGVPEAWLNQINPAWTNHFDAHAQEDSDGDSMNNMQEYVAGTDATNAQSLFQLNLGWNHGELTVSFPTAPDGGFYGWGGVRRYALEQTDDLTNNSWQGVAGLTNVAGEGQSVTYTNQTGDASRRFFRGRVWLEP